MEAEAAKFIGAGIACLGMGGAGIGLGTIFGNYLSGALRNPSAADGQFGRLIFGFAVTEALGIFSLLVALLLLFTLRAARQQSAGRGSRPDCLDRGRSMFVTPAYAQETAPAEGGAHGDPSKAHTRCRGGHDRPKARARSRRSTARPFPSQLLWLAITFGLFYLFLKKVVLPRLGGILEDRSDRIAQDSTRPPA